jgi:hypothetical protein
MLIMVSHNNTQPLHFYLADKEGLEVDGIGRATVERAIQLRDVADSRMAPGHG